MIDEPTYDDWAAAMGEVTIPKEGEKVTVTVYGNTVTYTYIQGEWVPDEYL